MRGWKWGTQSAIPNQPSPVKLVGASYFLGFLKQRDPRFELSCDEHEFSFVCFVLTDMQKLRIKVYLQLVVEYGAGDQVDPRVSLLRRHILPSPSLFSLRKQFLMICLGMVEM